MALERYGPPDAETSPQQQIIIYPVNQFLYGVFDGLKLEVSEVDFAADRVDHGRHIVEGRSLRVFED